MCSNRQTANAMGTSIRHIVRIRRTVKIWPSLNFVNYPALNLCD